MWEVVFIKEFHEWFWRQGEKEQDEMSARIEQLRIEGPALRRPHVGSIEDSIYPNMKELIVQIRGSPWRLFFVFDPKSRAIFLVGGTKKGKDQKRWYIKQIREAEKLYGKHLDSL